MLKSNLKKNRIAASSRDPKKLWEIINSKLGKSKKSKETIKYLYRNNTKIEQKVDIANYMNTYFCEVGSNLSRNIKQPNNTYVKPVERNAKSIFIRPTNTIEIGDIIKNLKAKSGGVDNINAKTLKTIAPFIVTPLHHIFNTSIEQAVWPNALKSAEVVPIHKAGDKTVVSNYRPISLISNIAKIFEKIIYNRLFSFLQQCNILADAQYGFVKGRGTTDALNRISDIIYEAFHVNCPSARRASLKSCYF